MAETQNKKEIKKDDGLLLGTKMSFLLMLPASLLMLPTVVFIFLAMMPTLVALLSGYKGNKRFQWMCVGGVNFAGALYFLFQLWFESATVGSALFLFLQVKTIVVTYGAAAVGYGIYKIVPFIVTNIQVMADQHRLVYLRGVQKKLIEQWGPDVAGDNK